MLALRFIVLVSTLLLPTLASAMGPEEVPNPRHTGGWVTDEADLLNDAQTARINNVLTELEAQTGVEVAVVTVNSVDSPTPKDFTTELFNLWGVGKAGSDNGLLIVLVTDERRLEMETGYGLEATLTDGWLKVMQERDMVPHFRRGDFGTGLGAGITAVDKRLRAATEAPSHSSPAESSSTSSRRGSAPMLPPCGWILGLGGLAFFLLHRKWLKTCPQCKDTMRILREDEDDAYLNAGQLTEEAVASVNYEVFECASCGVQRIHANSRWFSGYARCPECSNRTLASESTVTRKPTYTSTGKKRVTVTCAHCSHTRTYTATIPRRTRTQSSSSGGGFSSGGGGGSFGGGSSGGGGAGSSW
ncbi:TPM domain-containing protein [Bradymonadaceae bacterium TMQ3]|nr:TPM domain-containing protein [Bradymonadaceae bacterium TMQ3]TXC77857.1 TPM domain-containing protein [Bradymonadales bacterium TMQ1]